MTINTAITLTMIMIFFLAEFIATSCVNRSAFPLKLFSSQGCPSLDDSPVPDNCKAWSGGVDSATLSGSLLDGKLGVSPICFAKRPCNLTKDVIVDSLICVKIGVFFNQQGPLSSLNQIVC